MIDKSTWLLKQLLRRIWVRSALIALFGVLAALAGTVIDTGLPDSVVDRFGGNSVNSILNILASSMLAVTTFSLATAVQAYASAASIATPRASRLLEADTTTQNVLATFVGAFLFSLVGIVALSAHIYGAQGRAVLFGASAIVIVLVVVTLLKWIDHITSFGRMDDTLQRVEAAADKALMRRSESPCFGCTPAEGPPPESAHAVCADKIGHVQHIDISALAALADEHGRTIWLQDLPGSFTHPAMPLLHIDGPAPEKALQDSLRKKYSIRAGRDFDQDPRFGLIVLSEIASRALSPAVNDPGTAIDVIGRQVRLLSDWAPDTTSAVSYPRLIVPQLDPAAMLEDAFAATARDGAAFIEVQITLQRALAILAALKPETFAAPARALAVEARARAEAALSAPQDIERLKAAIRRGTG